jgi:hypothetical protein
MPIEFSRQARQGFSPEFKARIMQVYGLFPELQGKRISCGLPKGAAGSRAPPPDGRCLQFSGCSQTS